MTDDTKAIAIVRYLDKAVDGPGWYYWDDEYPEEGVCGAFASAEEAVEHAKDGDYEPRVIRTMHLAGGLGFPVCMDPRVSKDSPEITTRPDDMTCTDCRAMFERLRARTQELVAAGKSVHQAGSQAASEAADDLLRKLAQE